MSSATPHTALVGFGYLEPLARPICHSPRVAPVHQVATKKLPAKVERLTQRLAAKSQWLRQAPDPARSPSPSSWPSSTSRTGSDSEYVRSGVWPRLTPPKPVEARTPRSTALERRKPETSEFHSPPLPPDINAAADGDEEEEGPFHWRRGWQRVARADVHKVESATDAACLPSSSVL